MRYLTTREVAEQTGYSEGRVRELMRSGALPSVQLVAGGRRLVREDDLASTLRPKPTIRVAPAARVNLHRGDRE